MPPGLDQTQSQARLGENGDRRPGQHSLGLTHVVQSRGAMAPTSRPWPLPRVSGPRVDQNQERPRPRRTP
ncbi:hypothetical protein FRIGORI9N_330014 [Frigoribacterium sp. 9N]|nr:hypothetical protein FRIGORI9N_330014 [Frigoribacterium sp. 9N]